MKRIFYFTGHRLTAFHWNGKQFTGACSFEPDDNGFLKFEQYLQSAVNVRTKLLVDVIEEDFRIESIPHVYGKDKHAVTKRLLDRHYRSSNQFTYAEVIDRQKSGRKDDNVLLGAITNPKLLEPWLEIIDKCSVPISGIWTLPLISRSILSQLNVGSEAVLLVSQQVSSNLRQSFFKNKKLVSSRTSVLNQDTHHNTSFGELAEVEIAKTLAYLRGQGHIASDDLVDVHVIASSSQIPSLEQSLVSDEHEQYYLHDVVRLEKDIGISGLDSKYSDGLFSWLCLKSCKINGHYGGSQVFRQFYYSLASSALYVASIITLVFGVLVTESNISDSLEVNRSIDLINQQKIKFEQTYNEKFKEFESVLDNAKVMNASVKLYKQIKDSNKVNPLDFFIELSRSLSATKSGDIFIDKIEWASEQALPTKKNRPAEFQKSNLVLNYPVEHTAIVTGRIPISSDDYRASVKRIESIVTVLKSAPRIIEVKTLSMPVEMRSERQFSGESGLQVTDKKSDVNEGSFSLLIKMKAQDDV